MDRKKEKILKSNVMFRSAAAIGVSPDTVSASFVMPPTDDTTPDLRVRNRSSGTIWVGFAANAALGPTAPGCLCVEAGCDMVLTERPSVLAETAHLPSVTACQGGAYSMARVASILGTQRSLGVTIERGTVSLGSAA